MKTIQHKTFVESVVYPIWSWNARAKPGKSSWASWDIH